MKEKATVKRFLILLFLSVFKTISTHGNLPCNKYLPVHRTFEALSQVDYTDILQLVKNSLMLGQVINHFETRSKKLAGTEMRPANRTTLTQVNSSAEYFRSRRSGTWMDPDTWESSPDKLTWVTTSFIPTHLAREVLISEGDTVTMNGHANAQLLIIAAGGMLTNSDGNGVYLLTIEKTQENADAALHVYGTLILSGREPQFKNGATATIYEHALVRADGNTGGGSDAIARNTSVYFKNQAVFEWNNHSPFATSGAVYFPHASATEIPVFKVSKNPGTVGAGLFTINGMLEVNTDFTLSGGSNKFFRNGIRGTGTLTQNTTSGNRFTIGNNGKIGGQGLHINLSFPMHLTGEIFVPEGTDVTIQGANINNNLAGNKFVIEGKLDISNILITNTNGSVIIKGLFRTAGTGSVTSELASIPSGNVVLLPGSTIDFYNNGNQTFKSREDFSNIIFSGAGIKRASSGFSPHGTISIEDEAILDSRGQNIGNDQTILVMKHQSRLILNTVGRSPSMDGGYHLSGGVIQFDNTGVTRQTIRGTYGQTPGVSFAYNQIEVTGTSVGNGAGHILLGEEGRFTVKTGGIFEINSNAIKAAPGTGNQQVIIESGGEFRTGNKLGFHGLEEGGFPVETSSVHANIIDIHLDNNSIVNYHRENPHQTGGNQKITATIPYGHLILSGNEEKIVQDNGYVEIRGDLKKSAGVIFNHNNSTVTFNGAWPQNYESGFPQMIFNHLINENRSSLNIRDSLSVLRILTLKEKSVLNILGNITLLSNQLSTAQIAPLPNDARINYGPDHGFIVERYFQGNHKAWQFLSVPVYGNHTIHDAWQEGMAQGMSLSNNTPGAPGNLRPGYGTTITSNRLTWHEDGFDLYTAAGPSLKTFNSALHTWEGIASTHQPFATEKGYMMLVRGDRSVITHNQKATPVTLRSKGKIYDAITTPPTVVMPPESGKFLSVANPFASSIDFYSATKTNLAESYTIWDPQLTNGQYSAYGLGAYRTISNGYVVPSGGNYTDGSIPPIQSGQAFFIQRDVSDALPGTITFSEKDKVSGSHLVFRGGILPRAAALLRLNLYQITNADTVLLDGSLSLLHDEYHPDIDKYDAIKMLNSGENLGIAHSSNILAIERRPFLKEKDTIFYSLSGLKKQRYLLECISEKTEAFFMKSYIEDTYVHSKTFLDSSGKTRVPFEVNGNPGSFKENRFRVVFENDPRPLSLTKIQLTAKQMNKQVHLQWNMDNDEAIIEFQIEKSLDGINFFLLSRKESAKGTDVYILTDRNPAEGNNYYRLKAIATNGKIAESTVVKISMKKQVSATRIFPNPIEKNVISLHFYHPQKGIYNFRIKNTGNQVLYSGKITHTGEYSMISIPFKRSVQGLYWLELSGPEATEIRLKILKL